jgi:hypothetical protein
MGRPFFLGTAGYVYGSAGRITEAREFLAELEGCRSAQIVSPLYFCWAYLGIGDKEAAAENFKLAVLARDPMLSAFTAPMYDPLRDDPRFRSVTTIYAPSSQPIVRKLLG